MAQKHYAELTIGRGLVDIAHITGDRQGLIIHPRKSAEGPPEITGDDYDLQPGDVLIWIEGPEHADVLLRQLAPYRRSAAITDAMLEAMARAADAEESAQRGEPSPWRDDFAEQAGPEAQEEFRQERIAAMRCAVEALAPLLPGVETPTEWPERNRDIAWLERQKYGGHCGEENADIRARQDHNDRVDRIIERLGGAK